MGAPSVHAVLAFSFMSTHCQLNGSCRFKKGFKEQKMLVFSEDNAKIPPGQGQHFKFNSCGPRVEHNSEQTRLKVFAAEASPFPAAPCTGLSHRAAWHTKGLRAAVGQFGSTMCWLRSFVTSKYHLRSAGGLSGKKKTILWLCQLTASRVCTSQ